MLGTFRGAPYRTAQLPYRAQAPPVTAPPFPGSINPGGNVGLAGPVRLIAVSTGRAVVFWLWLLLGVAAILALIDLAATAAGSELARRVTG
jgi:hypothetical protein